MSYFPQKDKHIKSDLNSTTTPLASGASFIGTGELNDYSDVMVQVATDQDGTLWYDFSMDGTNWDTTLPFPYRIGAINAPHVLVKGYRYFRVRFVNDNDGGNAQSYLRLYTFYGELNKLTAPTNGTLSKTYDALVTRPTDFAVEVVEGIRQGVKSRIKFGGNFNIASNTKEDFWNGGGEYTGFNATAAETVTVVSSSANDVGTLLSSGTADNTSTYVLTDSAATFITSGVQALDTVINDTLGLHGVVKSVDSETQITIHDNQIGMRFVGGNSYRIARAGSTGAGVVKISGGLDGDYEILNDEYIILNGTTPVTSTQSYLRLDRMRAVNAGSSGLNEGEITVAQSVTTANVFAVMPTDGQTKICASSVPDNYVAVFKRINIYLARDGAQSSSADVFLYARELGGAWNAIKRFAITTSSPVESVQLVGLRLDEYTDFKLTVDNASSNVKVTGELEYFLIEQ